MGVVHNERHVMAMGDARKLLDVEHGAPGIADGLAEERLGVGPEGFLYGLLRVVGVDECAVYAQLLERYAEEVECASVDLVARHDMVACLADVEHGIEVGGLSAAGQHGPHAPFELRNLLGHHVVGGVLQSGVEIAFLLEVEEHGHLLRVIIFECSALDDGRFDGFAILSLVASVHTEGSRA